VKQTTHLHLVTWSEMVDLYLHSPICFLVIVLYQLNTGTTLPFLYKCPWLGEKLVIFLGFGDYSSDVVFWVVTSCTLTLTKTFNRSEFRCIDEEVRILVLCRGWRQHRNFGIDDFVYV
jgi:hypothetical protein